jgi:hypothetical protein
MSELMMISVVHRTGVFVPQADVTHLPEGMALSMQIPAPDAWDRLLEEMVAAELAAQDALEVLPWTRSRWDDLSPDLAVMLVEPEAWLGWWNMPAERETGSLLL